MKKKAFKFFTVSIFSFLTAILISCEHINTDAYLFESTNSIMTSGIKNVKLIVSSNANLFSVRKTRTIAPSAYDASELNFYLGGKNIGSGDNISVQKVEFIASEDSDSSGIIIAPLNSYNYQLVLLAIPKTTSISLSSSTYVASIASSAVLAGSTTADLRYNNNSAVNFYLSSEGLTGKGAYAINFYLDNWSAKSLATNDPGNSNVSVIDNVSIGLYDKRGENVVSGTSLVSQIFSGATSASSTFSYTNSSVDSGTYDLCVTFYYNDKTFVYSDKIIILPYQTTSATIAIPDILQVVPASPSNFKQGYLLPENEDSNYYKAAFSWSDNSNTETGFEIQLLDISDTPSITVASENNADTWSLASSTKITTYSSDFEGGNNWYALSLSRNSSGAVFYLQLGKRYLARIRSVNNDIGGSEWCYASSENVSLTIPAGDSTATSLILTYDETISATSFDSAIINLFKITYNLVGGTLSPVIAKTYYFNQSSSGIPVLTPDGTTTNDEEIYGNSLVSLSYGELEWSYWAINNVDGEKYPSSFTQCTSVSDYDVNTTYYTQYTRTSQGLSSTDINGNSYIYLVAEEQPDSFSDYTNNYYNYYTTDGIQTNYIGYNNLSLYAQYKDDDSGNAVTTDYSIKTNLSFSVLADGSACSINNYMFTVPTGSSSVIMSYSYNTSEFTYDSVSLTLTENGGSEIGTYSPSSGVFSFSPSALSSGIYTLTITAMKSGSEFRTSLFMILE
ncbi:MAG: hypothetical protein IJP61_00095 [Treponema sp.]|nr:hypothetical protein [Treponema sp.]